MAVEHLKPSDDELSRLRSYWSPAPGVTYLNHGSWGLSPECVKEERRRWLEQVEADPMDFFVRRQEGELSRVREKLGEMLGANAGDLAGEPCITDTAEKLREFYAENTAALFPEARAEELIRAHGAAAPR